MSFLFREELDEVFRSDRSIWRKIGCSALVSVFVVALGLFWSSRQHDLPFKISPPLVCILAGVSAALGALLCLALSFKDVVARRIERGDPVHPMSRIYFGGGIRCLAYWSATIILLVFAVSVIVSTLAVI